MKFPAVAAAFRDAELTYSQVRLLLRHLTVDNELELLSLALSLSYSELEAALAGRGPGDEGPALEKDSFRIWIDKKTRRYRFTGDLSPDPGAAFAAALKAGELANLRDLAADDAEAEGPGNDPGPSVTRFGPPLRFALFSGLLGMINLARSARTNAVRAPDAQVHVMFTEDGHAFLPSNPAAPAKALSSTSFNGEFRGRLLGSKAVTMKLGRSRRLISDGQATALLARWMFRCAMPGCNHDRFPEFHHIAAFAGGGPTDAGNLMPLCSACHFLVTGGLATVGFDPMNPVDLLFSFRDGSAYVPRNRGLPRRDDLSAPTLDGDHRASPAGPVRTWDEDPTVNVDDVAGRRGFCRRRTLLATWPARVCLHVQKKPGPREPR